MQCEQPRAVASPGPVEAPQRAAVDRRRVDLKAEHLGVADGLRDDGREELVERVGEGFAGGAEPRAELREDARHEGVLTEVHSGWH